MHFGLVAPDLTGHLNPLCTLGGALRQRGHRVTLCAAPDRRRHAEREELEHLPLGATEAAALARQWQALGELSGLAAARHTGRLLSRHSAIVLRELEPLLQRGGIDALVVDQFSPGGAQVAERLQLPFAIACNALASHYDDTLPPPPSDWRYRPDWVGLWRNRLADWAFRPLYGSLSGAGLGAPFPLQLLYEPNHALVQVAQQPAFFDFPRKRLPGHFHYTAPWHRLDRDDGVPFPWERLDGRPLLYASMGTLQNRLLGVLQTVLDAATRLDMQVVLSLGRAGAEAPLQVPPGAIITPFAPQLRLLQRAAAAVTHGGMNTVLECLACGVPMVCIPVTNDQPGVARRVEYLGLGEAVLLRRATTERVAQALRAVLQEPRFRAACGSRREELHRLNGPALAAELIEQACQTGQRILRKAG